MFKLLFDFVGLIFRVIFTSWIGIVIIIGVVIYIIHLVIQNHNDAKRDERVRKYDEEYAKLTGTPLDEVIADRKAAQKKEWEKWGLK